MVRNDSLGAKSTGSLHRATPVPADLSSTTSSGKKLLSHRLSTPTIQENENDRCDPIPSSDADFQLDNFLTGSLRWIAVQGSTGQAKALRSQAHVQKALLAFRGSSLDSNEHYYGRSRRFSEAASSFEVPPEPFVQSATSELRSEPLSKYVNSPVPPTKSDLPQPVAQAKAAQPIASAEEVTLYLWFLAYVP